MRWLRKRVEKGMLDSDIYDGREVFFIAGYETLGIVRHPGHGNAWVIFGNRRDGSGLMIVSCNEIIEDVKREAEGYL